MAEEPAGLRDYVTSRGPALYRTAYLLVGNRADAEDLVQATLVRLVGSWHRVERVDAPDAYVRRIMVNLAANRWRKIRTLATITSQHRPADQEPDLAETTAVRAAMWAAIQSLPVRMRAVVVLRFYEDLDEAQVAAVLGCSRGTVKSQTSKALARLRERLDVDDLTVSVRGRPSAHPTSTGEGR